MAIVKEHYKTREDGMVLIRTYSDAGFMIERDGKKYNEAIDPEGLGRTYTETDERIILDDLAETEQKAAAYDILMGVSE